MKKTSFTNYSTIVPRIQDILERLSGIKEIGSNKYMALCPAHRDGAKSGRQSLSVSLQNGKVLTHCFAGCTPEEVYDSLNLGADNMSTSTKTSTIISSKNIYKYHDAKGDLVFEVIKKPNKKYMQRRPDGNNGYIWNVRDIIKPLYKLPGITKALEKKELIFIAEGEKDVDNLVKLGLTATCNAGGAGKWSKSYTEALTNANVVILPDNDEPGLKHALKIAAALAGKAKSIKILKLDGLPDKGDVTDWIESGGTKEELLSLVEKTKEHHEVDNGAPKKKDELIEEDRPYFKSKTFVPKRLAEAIMQEYHFKCVKGTFYTYENGVYVPGGEELIKSRAFELLGEDSKKNRIEEVVFLIKIATVAEVPVPTYHYINVKNGRIKVSSWSLEPHDPKHFDLAQIPINFNLKAECREFDKYLKSTLGEELIPLAYEIFGYCLLPHSKAERAIMLTGEGSNGKSVFIDTLKSFLGRTNISNISLQSLSENRFAAAGLFGKLANLFADIDRKALTESGPLKMLTSGDSMVAEEKFKASFSFENHAKLIFSANELPRTLDNSSAFFRRWLIVPFTKTFVKGENADVNLREKLTTDEELSGILVNAIQGLMRLIETGYTFSETEATANELNKYREDNDSVLAFCNECAEIDEKGTIKKQYFYDLYHSWCDSNGLKAVSKRRIPAGLKKFNSNVSESRTMKDRFWIGIKLKESSLEYNHWRK
ncbi:MAG: hypothetical protein COA82_12605 [Alkaliphilus sp.]|nr:hypothetical protein [bacterium AH-315-E09]PHS29514.1 MAG: hypothetical protein COA82_12605 [Alkaliphilus sp.]